MEIDEIKCGEGERLEFKRALTKDDIKWLKTVVALANGRGGRIIFGVDSDLSLEKMMQGYSNCRNKALAEAFVYMNIIENWGSGIRRVKAEVKRAGLAAPEYVVWPNAIRVCLRRAAHAGEPVSEPVSEPVNEPVSEPVNETVKLQKVFNVVRSHPGIRMAEIMRLTGLSRASVKRHFVAAGGAIVFRGAPKTGGYFAV